MSSLQKKFKFLRRRGRSKKNRGSPSVVIEGVPVSPSRVISLGVGFFPTDGAITFLQSRLEDDEGSVTSGSSCEDCGVVHRSRKLPVVFKRISSSFIRVADLEMTNHTTATDDDDEESFPNFHHAAVDPPVPSLFDPQEEWVALDDGAGSHAPIAPFAVAALARFGIKTAMNRSMWKPEYKTDRVLKSSSFWVDSVWQEKGEVHLPRFPEENEVLVWSGNFIHGLYGSDLPAVRAVGIINMNAKALCDLLIDSTRVQEYNKLSLGRTDLMVLQGSMQEDGPFGRSITKIMKSESKPPLVRKTMQLVSVLHATELDDGCGYLLVTRAVTQPSEIAAFDTSLRSEILMGVNVIRRIAGEENRCLMVNVNHIRSPMIPMIIAKKIGLSAACNFIAQDIRSLCR